MTLLDLPTVALWDKTESLFVESLFSSSLPLSDFNLPGSDLGGKIFDVTVSAGDDGVSVFLFFEDWILFG